MADFDKIKINGVPYNVKDTATAQAVALVKSDLAETKTTVQQQGQQITQQGQTITQHGQQITQQGQQITQQGQQIEQITENSQMLNAVTYGIDNTGATDASSKISEFLASPAACHFFPTGIYRIDNPVTFTTYDTTNDRPNSILAMGDAVFRAGRSISTLFNVTGAGIGDGIIQGGVYDCAQLAESAFIVSGNTAPGFEIVDARIEDATEAAVVVGSGTQNSAGHQRFINVRIYNTNTLAIGYDLYMPDVKIYNTEVYYTRNAIRASKNIFVNGAHLWSGGSAMNTDDDIGILIQYDGPVFLTDVYFDSFNIACECTGHIVQVNAKNIFLYNDAERTFSKNYTLGIDLKNGSTYNVDGYVGTTSNAKIIPIMYDDIYTYCVSEENKFAQKHFYATNNEAIVPLSPYYDMACNAYPVVLCNAQDTMQAGVRRQIGYIMPGEDSVADFSILTKTGVCHARFPINRSSSSIDFGASKNDSATITFEVGGVVTKNVGSQQVLAFPIYITPATTTSEVTIVNNGSPVWLNAIYNYAPEDAINIIGTLSHRS